MDIREVGDRKLESGIANMRAKIRSYKNCAKRRGLEYSLTEGQFKEITQQDCYYCGIRPNQIGRAAKGRKLNGDYIYNGLDRIDNTKGYVIDNIVPCCKQCNTAKGTLTLQEFQNWIVMVYNKGVL